MVVLKWLAVVVVAITLLIGTAVVIAPFQDGPTAMIPGGALEAGELISAPVVDWSFATEVETVEMQLIADDNRSRTTWISVDRCTKARRTSPAPWVFRPASLGTSWRRSTARQWCALRVNAIP